MVSIDLEEETKMELDQFMERFPENKGDIYPRMIQYVLENKVDMYEWHVRTEEEDQFDVPKDAWSDDDDLNEAVGDPANALPGATEEDRQFIEEQNEETTFKDVQEDIDSLGE